MTTSIFTEPGAKLLSFFVALVMAATMPMPKAEAGGINGAAVGFVLGAIAGGAIAKRRRGGRVRRHRRGSRRVSRRSKSWRQNNRAPTVVMSEFHHTQKHLFALGYYFAAIDGNLGTTDSRNAILSYQQANGLPQTGHLFPEESAILKQQASLADMKRRLSDQTPVTGRALKRKIQVGLKVFGLYQGKIDGKIGRKSRQSIASFQQQNGFPPTGELGFQDMNHLFTTAIQRLGESEQRLKTQLASIAQTRGPAIASATPKVQTQLAQTQLPQTLVQPSNNQPSRSIVGGNQNPQTAIVNSPTQTASLFSPVSAPNQNLAIKSRPDAVAIIIGNKNYVNTDIPEVEYAIRDADAMKKVFIEQFGVEPDNVLMLQDATKATIEQAFGTAETIDRTALWSYVEPESDVYVYYSGHGMPTKDKGDAYILPVDADPNSPNISGYPLRQLYANLNKVKARSITVFVEACFSGGSSDGMLIKNASPIFAQTNLEDLATGNITVFTASRGDEIASWDRESGHGVFTKYTIDGLTGAADEGRFGNGDGVVTAGELQSYLAKNVRRKAKREYKRFQTPVLDGNTEQVLALLK